MKILIVNPSHSKLPVPDDLIRADTHVSIPLAEGLQKKGHEVTFVTSRDSVLSVKQVKTDHDALFSVIPPGEFYGISEPLVQGEIINTFFTDIFLKALEEINTNAYDIIHFHSDLFMRELPFAAAVKNTPIVITLHSKSNTPREFSALAKQFNPSSFHFVSISRRQQSFFPFEFVSTVYNGIDTDKFQFSERGSDHMLYCGRLRKIKGFKVALDAAVATNRPLHYTGKTSTDIAFLREEAIPIISAHPDLIAHEDKVDRSNIQNFYANGKLTLLPILWEEPFGLVMTESMACGTPVVTFANGSVPEVMKDGETGFIVNPSENEKRGDWIIKRTGLEGLCEAIEKIYSMPQDEYLRMRKNCRKHIEENFAIPKMVDEYEKVYKSLL